jgi:hypothetical protein
LSIKGRAFETKSLRRSWAPAGIQASASLPVSASEAGPMDPVQIGGVDASAGTSPSTR